jgi:predicted ribosomally synthesized peptide with SipW-like signal peptide
MGSRRKRRFKRRLLLAVGAVLLVCASVGATMAYFTSRMSLSNAFTVGNVSITLDEARVDAGGVKIAGAPRVTSNAYKLVPGRAYDKDPTVHLRGGSEASYLFVRVTNGIADIESTAQGDRNIAGQILDNGWKPFVGDLYYQDAPEPGADGADYPVFSCYAIDGAVGSAVLAAHAGATIEVTAYAVQKGGFEDATAAWNATFGASAP